MNPFLTSILILLSLSVFSQKLEKFEFSECLDEELTYSINNRIVSQKFEDDLFVIEISVVVNCCGNELGSIDVDGDTLRLFSSARPEPVEDENGDLVEYVSIECDCICCFTFKYFISGLEKKAYSVFYEDKPIKESEH